MRAYTVSEYIDTVGIACGLIKKGEKRVFLLHAFRFIKKDIKVKV
jgi:hypothetical protein